MQLYVDSHFTSPYALSAFVALHEKQIPFDLIPLDLYAEAHKTAAYAKQSLSQRIPLLVDGDFSLAESSAITEYLNDAWQGQPLYPEDLQQRARARMVQAWIRSDFMPIRQERSTVVVFYRPSAEALSEAAQQSAQKLFAGANELLAHGKPNLCGDNWSIADVDLALMLQRLLKNGDAVPEHLANYANYQWQRPSVQLWVNQVRPGL